MIGKDISIALQLLKNEKVVAIPTETVYGLAGNALSTTAVSEIYAVKQRPDFNPLIIHVADIESISKYVTYFPPMLKSLAEAYMPGPLSLLLPKADIIPDMVTSGSERVAVRIPGHPLTQSLLGALNFPLAAPSANPFGYISPTTAVHVEQQLGSKIPYILDGGDCTVGIESTIVGVEDNNIVVYRKGGLSIEAIETIAGKVVVVQESSSQPSAPGMLSSHYAPKIPLKLGNLNQLVKENADKNFAIIGFCDLIESVNPERQFILSRNRDYKEAARNLFGTMRTIDNSSYEVILAELLPEEDLGRAINDRLKRAAY